MPVFGAIDIGSNSVRLSIARLHRGKLKQLHQDREVTRLGAGVFRNGELDSQAMADTVKVLQRFHKATQKFAVDQVRLVATSAMRDSSNSGVFREWVKSATGWKLEVISGLEEGRLIHLGIIANTKAHWNRLMLLDLGGGSIEVTLSQRGHIAEMISLPLGAVRLTQEFVKHDPPLPEELERMQRFIEEELGRLPKALKRPRPQRVIATSGTAAAVCGAILGNCNRLVATSKVEKLYHHLAKMELNELDALKGINPKRAEIIVAGSAVYATLLRSTGCSGFHFSPLGLRDGLLAQMAAEFDEHSTPHRQLHSDRRDVLESTARRYRVDIGNSEHVRQLSLQLFQQLKNIHGLKDEYRDDIGAAALLQECGNYVNPVGRNRHAYYIISHSELFGFDPQARQIIATIARYQGKSTPRLEDRMIKALPSAIRADVIKAVAILRLARALNQGRHGAVRSVRCRLSGGQVRVKITAGRAGADLELWAAEKQAAHFRSVFGRELVISVA